MSQATLEALLEAWPGRITLRADEVALVLRGKQTRKVVERIRNNMKAGVYGAGASKVDGVWQLPITDLAEVIEPTPVAPPIPKTSITTSPRRSQIGPRLTFVVQARFWAQVLKALGEQEAFEELNKEASSVYEELAYEYREEKAKRERHQLREALGLKYDDIIKRYKDGGL